MNLDKLDRVLDKLDRVLDKAPYMLLWLAVVLVVISIASQTYMYVQRRAYAGPADSVVFAGGGQRALD